MSRVEVLAQPAVLALGHSNEHALQRASLKLVRKRAGVSHWAQKLCWVLESYSTALQEDTPIWRISMGAP